MVKNSITIVGNLGKDPQYKESTKGGIAFFSLAEGFSPNHTNWHSVVVFGDLANHVVQRLKKGALVRVEGCLKVAQIKDDSGKYADDVTIYANSVELVPMKPKELPPESIGVPQKSQIQSKFIHKA